MAFQNINGIGMAAIDSNSQEITVECEELGVDVLAMSEINVKITAETKNKFHEGIRRQNKNYKLTIAHNHLKAKNDFKPGGVGLLAIGRSSGRIVEQRQDKMGRWTETVF